MPVKLRNDVRGEFWEYFIHQVLSKTKELVASKEIYKKKNERKKRNKTHKCLEEQGG